MAYLVKQNNAKSTINMGGGGLTNVGTALTVTNGAVFP